MLTFFARLRHRWLPPAILLMLGPLSIFVGGRVARQSKASANPATHSPLRVTIINVEQGEAALVRTPSGETIVIGTGSRETGTAVVEALQNDGVQRIDLLILPYPSAEAIGGVPLLYDAFEIGSVIEPGGATLNTDLSTARGLGREYQTPWRTVRAGESFTFPSDLVRVEILSPPTQNRFVPPDNSLVVAVRYRDVRFLFAGGISAAGERALLAVSPDLRANVLRVARFGSSDASTPEFLRQVRPEYAIISVGANGDSFPSKRTVTRLHDIGAIVSRTDAKGGQSVSFISNGDELRQGTKMEEVK